MSSARQGSLQRMGKSIPVGETSPFETKKMRRAEWKGSGEAVDMHLSRTTREKSHPGPRKWTEEATPLSPRARETYHVKVSVQPKKRGGQEGKGTASPDRAAFDQKNVWFF